MFPFSSAMCFTPGSRSHHWVVVNGSATRSDVEVSRADGFLHVQVSEHSRDDKVRYEAKSSSLSSSERCMIETLDVSLRPLTERFLTLQRRRTRGPVATPGALGLPVLDDSYTGTTNCLLSRSGIWDFNAFSLDVGSGGKSASVLLVHLFHQYDFIAEFHLDAVKVHHCFCLIESGYHTNNPYHNAVHAADVSQAMHCFMEEEKISRHLSPLEGMACLIGAVAHDLDHPGVNQPFLIATSNHLASLYKNFSVLENHHWRSAMSCLKESRMFDHLTRNMWTEVEWCIRSLILATDITRQQEFLTRFKRYLEARTLDLEDREYRHFILQIALKCADLCNPCRSWETSRRWSHQVCQEFYRQGDYERQLDIPVTPMCDRTKSTIAKIQADFFKFVVFPLFEMWNSYLESALSRALLRNLNFNYSKWLKEVDRAEKSEKKAIPTLKEEASHPLPCSDIFSRAEETVCGRRCSMPLSIPKMLPRTTIRRQSFPKTSAHHDKGELLSFFLHRSPHISLRSLSVEQLKPKLTIVSLSSGTGVSLLRKMDMEMERKLVHQPASYPPYIMHHFDKEEGAKGEGGCTNGCCGSSDEEEDGRQSFPSPQEDSGPMAALVSRVPPILRPSMSSRRPDSDSLSQGKKDTWCLHVSLSAERSEKYFDSLAISSSRLTIRRGSAPVGLRSNQFSGCGDLLESRGGLRGGTTFARRWSIPSGNAEHPAPEQEGHRAVRRPHKEFGLLEPFLATTADEDRGGIFVPSLGRRRGSLPTDTPTEGPRRRRGSAGEILCALIGPAGALATFQGIAAAPPQREPPRRGSGGLELLSGFWRSRTSDFLLDPPPMGRLKLPRQSCSLDSGWRCEEMSPLLRGSLEVLSGNKASGDKGT